MPKKTEKATLGMPSRLQYTYPEKDRHGKVRWRYRHKGVSAQLPGNPGSDEFLAAYLEAKGSTVVVKSPKRVVSGSLRSLKNDFVGDSSFANGRSDATQKKYKRLLEEVCQEHGDKPYNRVEARHLKGIIQAVYAETPSKARHLHTALSMLFEYACEADALSKSPMRDVKRPSQVPTDGFHSWTDAEIQLYRSKYPVGSRERLAFELLLCTAQRGSDVHDLGWQHVKNGRIALRQVKTGMDVEIPILTELAECLNLVRDNMTFVLSNKGSPYTRKSFQQWFSKSCNKIGLNHCSAHGLRKARGRLLAENGKTEHQIMAVLGHKTPAMAAVYTRAASQKLLADQAMGVPLFPNLNNSLPNPKKRLV